MRRRHLSVLVALAVGLAACAGGRSTVTKTTADEFSAEAASFDLAANTAQRYSIGLIAPNEESVAYGSIRLDFVFDGPKQRPLARPRRGLTAEARFVPVAGETDAAGVSGPRLVQPSVARGVYKTEPITFDAAGFWEATARFTIDGVSRSATAAFEVLEQHQVPFVGDPAPPTVQPLGGDPAVPAVMIDSRAQDGAAIPDPALHDTTIAAALGARRPLMVVVATPTFCTSRFCGPTTDAVARLAQRDGDRMTFVHLELWADFANGTLNWWVKDWIVPRNGDDTREPWVFVVNRAGVITDRFDNLASDAELAEAAARALR